MKVIVDKQDRCGRYPIIFKNATIGQIHEYLFNNYNGYKFGMVFDETHDEFEEINAVYVYFLDELLDEAAAYANKQVVN